jgi:hypothetical protein
MNDWKKFSEEIPEEKKHILCKREYTDEEFAEWEGAELFEKVDYLTGVLEDNTLRMGDRNGAVEIKIDDEYLHHDFWTWRYVE